MTNPEHTASRSLVILLLIMMLVQLGVIVYVFVTDFQDDKDRAQTSRTGCERGKKDRRAAVTVNKNIVTIFENSQKNVKAIDSPERKKALRKIRAANVGLVSRAQLNCEKLWPDPRWP